MKNLYDASRQWAERPPDERFWTLGEMHERARAFREEAAEATVPSSSLRFQAGGEEIYLTGREGNRARMLNYSFGQACSLVGAPAGYLRTLPAETATDLLNIGMGKREEGNGLKLLFRQNGAMDVRSLTSEQYGRLWNADVIKKILPLQERGWKVPPARPASDGPTRIATVDDCLKSSGFGLSVNPGDEIGPAGLYLSDKDMFIFMVSDRHPVEIGERAYFRGFFAENSEVGDRSFRFTFFLLAHVCGNHICWDVPWVTKIRVVHRGKNVEVKAFRKVERELRNYLASSTERDRELIQRAIGMELGKNKEEVVENLFGKRIAGRSEIGSAYDLAEAHPEDEGNPTSVWGMAQGFTRFSQESKYADKRVAMDRASGKVLKIAF